MNLKVRFIFKFKQVSDKFIRTSRTYCILRGLCLSVTGALMNVEEYSRKFSCRNLMTVIIKKKLRKFNQLVIYAKNRRYIYFLLQHEKKMLTSQCRYLHYNWDAFCKITKEFSNMSVQFWHIISRLSTINHCVTLLLIICICLTHSEPLDYE